MNNFFSQYRLISSRTCFCKRFSFFLLVFRYGEDRIEHAKKKGHDSSSHFSLLFPVWAAANGKEALKGKKKKKGRQRLLDTLEVKQPK